MDDSLDISSCAKHTKLDNDLSPIEFSYDIWYHYIIPTLLPCSVSEIRSFVLKHTNPKDVKSLFADFLVVTGLCKDLYQLRFKYLPYQSVVAARFTYKVTTV
jgi:hypothetical protein